jgi:hypothetical protein
MKLIILSCLLFSTILTLRSTGGEKLRAHLSIQFAQNVKCYADNVKCNSLAQRACKNLMNTGVPKFFEYDEENYSFSCGRKQVIVEAVNSVTGKVTKGFFKDCAVYLNPYKESYHISLYITEVNQETVYNSSTIDLGHSVDEGYVIFCQTTTKTREEKKHVLPKNPKVLF